jgi:perosamine synthetase
MTSIRLHAPVVGPHAVTFGFTCDSDDGLYLGNTFALRFPPEVDTSAVPERLWWTIALLCLHPQWMVLRPCRVELPIRLLPGEAETWLRLMDAGIDTLESLRGTGELARSIELVEGDRDLPAPVPLREIGRCATAFSGGKDSLLQAALLAELTFRPVLVATTSPMAPFHDHVTERRRHVFREIAARRDVTFAEVGSDLRSLYANGWAAEKRGYPIAVSELTDAFLYLASLIVVGFAHGATHLFVASEAEVQENAELAGRVVQHPHFMYSTVTLGAVSALLRPHGLGCSTLTSPLHADSVQRLLWTRYRDLADLQYSCWNVPPDGAACSRCSQCLRIALCAVAAGGDPATMGVDLAEVLIAQAAWSPSTAEPDAGPRARVRAEIHAHIAHNLRAIGPARMLRRLSAGDLRRWRDGRTRAALRAYAGLRARARRLPAREIGWRPGALADVDPLVRARVGAIYGAAFRAEPDAAYRAVLERAGRLTAWIVAPLAARAGTGGERRVPVLAAVELRDPDDARVRALLPARDPVLRTDAGPVIPVSQPLLDGNELRYVEQAIRSGWISSGGPFVRAFEERFAALTGCTHAIACSSGTTALHLALAALGIGPGDEVIVPAFTMIASANAVAYTGATPVFVDAEPAAWNLDPAAVAAAVTSRTRAVVVVHTYGAPAEMDAIRAVATRHGLAVVEDAAEAHGAAYRGRPVGSLGDAATFSFYANKIVTTGEGGMVTTSDARFARVARRLRDHAFSEDHHFWHRYRGFNYRMTNLQAAVGVAQLERYDELVARRRRLAERYTHALRDLDGLTLPREQPGTTNVFWMYALLVGDAFGCTRDALRAALAEAGIETRTTFIPLHLQPIYREGRRELVFPVAEDLCARGLYLPTSAALGEDEIARVVAAVRAAARRPAAV